LELLRSARDGEWEAFNELMRRFEHRVFGLAWRILQQRQDAEDATQQTFVSVMDHLDKFREESSVATWVLRIATNHALRILRRRKTRSAVRLESSPDGDEGAGLPHPEFIAQWRDDPSVLAQRSEVKQLVADALEQLDEKYRVVFLLRDVEQLSTKETAHALVLTESNVKVRLLRARLQLREHLTAILGDEATRLEPHRH
jgi:RNA polymerase sigma-70 factor (ECF subfamily)